jgi:hypothetical protein
VFQAWTDYEAYPTGSDWSLRIVTRAERSGMPLFSSRVRERPLSIVIASVRLDAKRHLEVYVGAR